MKSSWAAIAAIVVAAAAAAAQESESSVEKTRQVEVYTKAISAMLGPADAAAPFSLASWIRAAEGRMLQSDVPGAVAEALGEAGYEVEPAELAENGLWQVPHGRLFIMLRKIDFWPGGKIAVFSIDVGVDPRKLEEEAFKFLRDEDKGWVLIEKGPAENES